MTLPVEAFKQNPPWAWIFPEAGSKSLSAKSERPAARSGAAARGVS